MNDGTFYTLMSGIGLALLLIIVTIYDEYKK